ncbi:MAG TPA: hypothetical protein PLD55_00605 [bacterium]|jgi:uncharacterized radical SAM superfamily Fe-S cluster-containing enzyme|nr:hypothetical protein [bacterium]HPY14662.1 hypothetical protein [bacterium]HQB09738.1 hypothetical protein [bacterium]HQM83159.1 hypothetical protein [bacterium]
MNYQDILYNFLTSSLIVGIATYLIQKQIDKRFNKIESFQKTLITIRKERYDTLLKTLQEIWEKIIETEYYIRHELNNQVEDAQQRKKKTATLDFTPLKSAFIFIEKKNILLTDALSCQTRDLFINHFQNTYNGYIKMLNNASAGEKTLDELNSFIPDALGDEYKQDLANLRKKFEEQAQKILYDESVS